LTASGSGSAYAPAWYVALATVPAITAIPFLPGRVDETLTPDAAGLAEVWAQEG
jgi:hypothetical protein